MKRMMLFLAGLVMLMITALGYAAEPPLVYIVNSYNPETFGWTAEENTGILAGFEQQGLKQGVDYELESDTMDALVKSSKEEMRSEAARILADIKKKQPDIVMTTDDDALQWVGLEIDTIPVVFNGGEWRANQISQFTFA